MSRFFYHALGVGLGGRIKRPFCDVIESQAATALGIGGGYASSRVDGYRFKDIVSVRSAAVYAAGSEAAEDLFGTSITVTVEGLDILGVITAERITARLASRHALKDAAPAITAIGTEFVGLRIAGHPIELDLDRDAFFPQRTFGEFETHTKDGSGFLRSQSGKGTLCSLVKAFPRMPGDLSCDGNSIKVPSVGRVFLGEVLVTPYARRLTMLRVELGSPVGGDLECATGEVDGSTFP